MDPRVEKLAKMLLCYSTRVGKGDRVLIRAGGGRDLVKALVRETYAVGGEPFVLMRDSQIERELMLHCTDEQLKLRAESELLLMQNMQATIGFSATENDSELSDVPAEQSARFNRIYDDPVFEAIQKNNVRWCVLRYPTPAMAQAAQMSTEQFEDFFYDVCTMDYARMDAAMDPMKELMERTDEVRIVGPGTDLRFSIKGLPACKCAGECNIPDGEIYTAPVRDSVEGVITYNTPSVQDGFTFENVKLTFKKGRIVEAEANDTERINKVLDTDEGARYIGEFALGVNPYITTPMRSILFDEKISGSFHFTPGMSYDDCFNGNRSAVHWDLVNIQTPEYGGGEIYFDGVLVRKDGLFVLPELACLNPENLK